jgi:hypothetical protein
MKIRQLPMEILDEVLLVPRIVIAVPLSHFAKKFNFDLVEAYDDLDAFKAIILALDETPFSLSHHSGNKRGQTTISLPVDIATGRDIAKTYRRIADELHIDDKSIIWQQDRDDPPRKFA